jgi:PAS domain S-box-containing protein
MISGASFDTSRDDGWMNSIHPDDRAIVIESWRTTFQRKSEFADELRFLRPDGIVRWVHARAAPLLSGTGDLIGYVGTVEDVTDRVDAHRLLERRLVALTEIAGGLSGEQPMSATLDTIAANVVESTNADACLIALLSEGSVANHIVGSVGIPANMISTADAVYRTGSRAFRLHAFHDQHPVILRELRQRILGSTRPATSRSITNAPWDTALFVPVVYRGQISGTVNAYYPPEVEPSDDELAFLRAVARHAALAIETTRLAATEREKAALEERQRLARELHDSVSQVLYGIGMGASAIHESLDSDPEQAREPTEYVLSLVQAGIAEMRALIFELRPDSIAQEGLVAALRKQAELMHARHGLAIEVMLDEEPEASLEMKEAIYRVGQEAMNNVVKHARASRLTVRLLVSAGGMALEIEDDGKGFDSTAEYPGHLGLQSMRERITRLRGDLLISGRLGSGTRIRAELRWHDPFDIVAQASD